MAAEGLVAGPLEGLAPLRDAREPLRVLMASLAPGGAERIVLEWLGAEAARGRSVELAVVHARRLALPVPAPVALRVRDREGVASFLAGIARCWAGTIAPVSTHLIPDDQLGLLWRAGLRTVAVVHNSRPGWRNDPAAWDPRHVPLAVACAARVREEMLAAGCRVPVSFLRHRPRVGAAATDPARRRQMREELRIGRTTLAIGAIGAIKAQKDLPRALEVLAALARRRDAVLLVVGGLLEPAALPQLERLLDVALRLGVADRLRLAGFVCDIAPWLAACDAIVNVSRYEGLSMAVQEALAAGLPVVATDVGGQREVAHEGLELLPAEATAEAFALRLASHPVRSELRARPLARAPRAWSLTLAWRPPAGEALDTLFVTANLNAGGAQRSLVNLAAALAGRHRFAVAACGASTHPAFAAALASAGVEAFEACAVRDDVAVAESLLAHAHARACRNLCFWNVAPGVKLLVSRFAPPGLRLFDVSPGRHAFEELEAARSLGEALDWPAESYYARLEALVLKHADPAPPPARRLVRIPNGVASRAPAGDAAHPRFLVSGRIAPSKRLEVIAEALDLVLGDLPRAEVHVFGAAEPRHARYARALCMRADGALRWRGADFSLGYLEEPWTAAVVLGIHQGCPNAVLEAMSAGVPVIANASGGTGELVDASTGWLLAEDCGAGEVACAMRSAWADAAGRAARSRACRGRAIEDHGLETMAARYLALLAPEARQARATIGR